MAWKQTSHPTVQKQRDKWVVRADGIDTEAGARKPRQLGTFPVASISVPAVAADTSQ